MPRGKSVRRKESGAKAGADGSLEPQAAGRTDVNERRVRRQRRMRSRAAKVLASNSAENEV